MRGVASVSGKHSPHVLRVICGSGPAALYGEIACAGGCQGVASMGSHMTAKAFLPFLPAVSMEPRISTRRWGTSAAARRAGALFSGVPRPRPRLPDVVVVLH